MCSTNIIIFELLLINRFNVHFLLAVNTPRLHYKYQLIQLMQFEEISVVYCENRTMRTGRFRGHTLWPESASELYLSKDRRLSAKLVPTFANRE
jgi:hypothetical protein